MVVMQHVVDHVSGVRNMKTFAMEASKST